MFRQTVLFVCSLNGDAEINRMSIILFGGLLIMKVLILGGQGMLGHKIFQVFRPRFDTYVTFRSDKGPWTSFPLYGGKKRTIGGIDAFQFSNIVDVFARVQPDVVINCIGIIKQIASAKDPIRSIEINALFPHKLFQLCLATQTKLIHISTDCVFSGQRGNYTEGDIPDPIDLYGRTKLLGELNQSGCLTLRTSVIGRDFVKRVGLLEWFLSNRGNTVKGYTQAIYSGFTTHALAQIIADLVEMYPDLFGLYHVASQPISKFELLVKIRDAMKLDIEIIPENDFFCDRSLDAARFLNDTRIAIPTWEEMISDLVIDSAMYDEWRSEG